MKTFKKIIATLLAIIISLSAGIIGFADESKSDIPVVIKKNSKGYHYICIFTDADPSTFEKAEIIARDENGDKTLQDTFDCQEFNEIFDFDSYEGFLVVTIRNENYFDPNGSYTITLYPYETPESSNQEDLISVDFDYKNCIEPEYKCTNVYETIEAGEELILSEVTALPQGFMGATKFDCYGNAFGDDDDRKIVSVRSSKITGIREGSATVYINDMLTEKTLCSIQVKVTPRKADNLFELIKLTFGEIVKSFKKSFSTVGIMLDGAVLFSTIPFLTAIQLFETVFKL